TTFRSYTTEILANDLKALGLSDVKHGGTHSVASLRSIWKSLTPNAKSAFLQLISLVLTDDASASSSGVTFWVWYRSCLDEFVVSSELALRQHLREFTDHHMVSKKTGLDGAEILTLNIDRHLLAEFFAQDDININIPGLSPQ
ncbi:unnamed protein product, partial [Soboliphyme baturini]|uniref:Origin recognition complex subunit 2 n=1 Tax=Soboliphyme baturini TaxID=241478 RepID=A0A183IQH9_9BILA